MDRLKKVLKWVFFVVVGAYIILVIGRAFYLEAEDRTKAAVEKIHATKLTLGDVMGDNLPPDPGDAADDTIAGIDANSNGIRDDVELAIFKEYPDSAKTRAVLLQYALALQMEVSFRDLNSQLVGAIEQQKSRGFKCIGQIISRDNMNRYIEITSELRSFIETKQINTTSRKNAQENFYEYLKSGEIPTSDYCDLNIGLLPN